MSINVGLLHVFPLIIRVFYGFLARFPSESRANSHIQKYIETEIIKQDLGVNSNLEPCLLQDCGIWHKHLLSFTIM